jgi:hypothetical protein
MAKFTEARLMPAVSASTFSIRPAQLMHAMPVLVNVASAWL